MTTVDGPHANALDALDITREDMVKLVAKREKRIAKLEVALRQCAQIIDDALEELELNGESSVSEIIDKFKR